MKESHYGKQKVGGTVKKPSKLKNGGRDKDDKTGDQNSFREHGCSYDGKKNMA